MGQKFFLQNGKGGIIRIEKMVRISDDRRRSYASSRAVILGEVTNGVFLDGDDIFLTDGKNCLLEDSIARIEIDCKPKDTISTGDRVGVLMMNHEVENIVYHAPDMPRPFI